MNIRLFVINAMGLLLFCGSATVNASVRIKNMDDCVSLDVQRFYAKGKNKIQELVLHSEHVLEVSPLATVILKPDPKSAAHCATKKNLESEDVFDFSNSESNDSFDEFYLKKAREQGYSIPDPDRKSALEGNAVRLENMHNCLSIEVQRLYPAGREKIEPVILGPQESIKTPSDATIIVRPVPQSVFECSIYGARLNEQEYELYKPRGINDEEYLNRLREQGYEIPTPKDESVSPEQKREKGRVWPNVFKKHNAVK